MNRDELGRQAPHVPTDESRAKVERLARNHVTQEDIAKVLGLSKTTIQDHYREELDRAYLDDYQDTVEALNRNVREGREKSIIFKLQSRYGSKGWAPKSEVENKSDATITVVHEVAPLPVDRTGWKSPLPTPEA